MAFEVMIGLIQDHLSAVLAAPQFVYFTASFALFLTFCIIASIMQKNSFSYTSLPLAFLGGLAGPYYATEWNIFITANGTANTILSVLAGNAFGVAITGFVVFMITPLFAVRAPEKAEITIPRRTGLPNSVVRTLDT